MFSIRLLIKLISLVKPTSVVAALLKLTTAIFTLPLGVPFTVSFSIRVFANSFAAAFAFLSF